MLMIGTSLSHSQTFLSRAIGNSGGSVIQKRSTQVQGRAEAPHALCAVMQPAVRTAECSDEDKERMLRRWSENEHKQPKKTHTLSE